jgi:hypothetical protein
VQRETRNRSCGVTLALWLLLALATIPAAQTPRIQVVPNDVASRVDVTIDGKPLTSYIYPRELKKPVLYPIRTANGTAVTRNFPPDQNAGERTDHPHHVGLWFNHGDVNGLDFWNNSTAIPAAKAANYGTIVHRRIIEAVSGQDRGELTVEMDWVGRDEKPVLKEQTRYVFRGTGDARSIDRITRLTALKEKVVFRDNKEGVLGIRVARALEHKAKDAPDVTGMYTSSEGLKGEKVWGTRGRWTMLTGTVAGEPVTLAILDHPSNPGFPTYWHARGYGLFAANMLGQKVFSEGKEELNLTIDPGASVVFRHRILILGGNADAAAIEKEYGAFTQKTAP